ncbi:hypothetical protein ykris0001_38680 [Yersinia kristensenii ATCC 33638]|nr:hypothetical protein ykris0001_38680 [Yersinia kristensenii ATCC 33638]
MISFRFADAESAKYHKMIIILNIQSLNIELIYVIHSKKNKTSWVL